MKGRGWWRMVSTQTGDRHPDFPYWYRNKWAVAQLVREENEYAKWEKWRLDWSERI